MKKLLLIGSRGQLGQDILKLLSDKKYSVTALNHKDLDICDYKSVSKISKSIKPDIIINTAAYHRVDETEIHSKTAFEVNSLAPRSLAQEAEKIKARIIFISTDYVFGLDKTRKTPYKENDLPGPINVYGVSKLSGEYFTQYICQKHYVIRTSGLFGTTAPSGKGQNFVELMIDLAKNKELNVIDDQILSPTYTLNLAQNILRLIETEAYGIYHMTSEGACSWWEFANTIFKLLSLDVKCNKVSSDYFKTLAKRPNYSVLENKNLKKLNLNLMKHWKDNLKLYLKEKNYLM